MFLVLCGGVYSSSNLYPFVHTATTTREQKTTDAEPRYITQHKKITVGKEMSTHTTSASTHAQNAKYIKNKKQHRPLTTEGQPIRRKEAKQLMPLVLHSPLLRAFSAYLRSCPSTLLLKILSFTSAEENPPRK